MNIIFTIYLYQHTKSSKLEYRFLCRAFSKYCTAISILLFPLISLSQDYPRKEFNPSTLADEIFSSQDLDINYQDLYENYLQLISNPLDLNQITDEQLRSVSWINDETQFPPEFAALKAKMLERQAAAQSQTDSPDTAQTDDEPEA